MKIGRREFCHGLLGLAVASGLMPPGSVAEAATAARASDTAFFVARGMALFEGVNITQLSAKDVPGLLDMPVRGQSMPDGLSLICGDGTTVAVRTCREYRCALAKGFFPNTNYDQKDSVWFDAADGLMQAVERGRKAKNSYVHNFVLGSDECLAFLPASEFAVFPDADEVPEGCRTLRDLVEIGGAILPGAPFPPGNLQVEWGDTASMFVELLRGDFDGDGLEEILVMKGVAALRGTVGGGGIATMVRRGPSELIEVNHQPFLPTFPSV